MAGLENSTGRHLGDSPFERHGPSQESFTPTLPLANWLLELAL